MAHTRKKKNITITDIVNQNEEKGMYFFSPDTMRFFNSYVEPEVYGNKYFITSEKRRGEPRLFTIREFDQKTANIKTVGEFQEFGTKAQAKKRIMELLGEK